MKHLLLLILISLICVSCTKESDSKKSDNQYFESIQNDKNSNVIIDSLNKSEEYDSLVISKNNTHLSIVNNISKFINVRYLEIHGYKNLNLKKLFNETASLKKIKMIKFIGIFNQDIPSEIGLLSNLESLNIINTDFEILPKEINRLKLLREIDINNTPLRKFPMGMSDLKRFEKLVLSGNTVSCLKVTKDFYLNNNIKILILSNFSSYVLPSWIKYMIHVEGLGIYDGKKIKNLPIEISNFKNLKTLDLINLNELNQNTTFKIIFMIPTLKILSLLFRNVNYIPDGIKSNRELEEIKIFGYNLQELSSSLLLLPKLQRIEIIDIGEINKKPRIKKILDSLVFKGIKIRILSDEGKLIYM